ncbi:gp53-like domain-containing protein [Serratia marcescens]|uniref:gp53-like domain-containing protein n=1 Tax=Serratia marcescens TaxID=615 RepID=UPI002772E8F8|nr:hypothetical protein [Serratia marcescens]MDP8640089.1 hypothetical protein [Serratia marcescens]
MHRIDTPTAQIDKFGPGKNGFTNGDPATGRRATDLNSDMWDAVQEEMANAIEGNGIALDKSKHNQLYLAIQKAITDPGFLKKANNLSDLANVAEARGNLQLGTAATKNVGTEGGNVMAVGAFGLGMGAVHRDDAYGNIAEFFRVNISSANRPGNNAYGGVRLPIDGAPTSGYAMVGGDLSAWVGMSTTQAKGVTWARVYTTAYKPTAADVDAWDKNQSDSRYLMKAEGGYIEKPITIRNTSGAMLSLIRGEQGGVGGQFIGGYNNDGNRLWWMGSGGNGVRDVALYSDAWGMGVSITQNGINADGNLLERGARVYSPYNPQPSQTSASLASNGWWRDNGTGMIYQWVNGINLSSAGGSSENVPFPISFPLGCLSVNVSVKGAAAEQVGWDNATNSSVIIVKGAGDGVYSRIANVFVIGF